jgi:plasmid stability protein
MHTLGLMASITIRNLSDDLKKRLRKQAAENGRSMEAEAREILARSTSAPKNAKPMTGLDIFKPLRDLVEKYGGFELEQLPRTPVRDPFAEERHQATGLADDAQPFRTAVKRRRK